MGKKTPNVPLKPGETGPAGHFAAVDIDLQKGEASDVKFLPWQEAAYHGAPGTGDKPNVEVWKSEQVPQHMVDQMHEGLPDPVRRTPRERYESLVWRLTATARETKQMYGRVVWPTSVQKVLTEIGVKPTADERTQVYALAKHYILKAENQQRRKDSKKTVLDWHGHYS